MALQQLLCKPDAHLWALRHVADFLIADDATRLVLLATQSGRADLHQLRHWLLHGDAPFPPLDTTAHARALRGRAARRLALCGAAAPPAQVEIPEDDLDIINTALIAAGEARQLRVIDWLVTATPRIHCVLPLDDELRAVCWYYTYDDKALFYNCATAQHGIEFAGASFDVASGDGLSDDKPTHMPFANKFARDGNLDTLTKIYARANHHALIAPHAMEAAAGSGHLEGGQVHVLQWTEQFGLPVWRSNVTEAASAGQVAALRWLRMRDESMWRKIHPEAMIQAAKHGRREVLEYYHEECGLPVTPSALKSLSASKSVETVEYVLDRIQATPAELQEMFHDAASDSNLAVAEYLVTQRRLWSREAFEAAVYRERSPQAKEEQLKVEAATALVVSQFLIQQARIRAETLGTPMADQVVLEDICILHLADLKNYAIAEWIARSVPEADCDSSGLLDGDNYPPKDADAAAMSSVVLACLTHRREQCRAVSWLPRWAVMEHPALGSIDVQRAIMDYSRDGRFMVPLLSRMTSGTLSTDIVTWAASYGIRPVLERVYAQESQAKRQRMLQLIATRGAEHGHVDVLEWVRATCETDRMPKVIVFADVASGGARCGRVEVLEWLLERMLLPVSDGDKINSIVREAARHRRVDSLRWLLAYVAVPTRVVAQILVDAAKNDRDEIVCFLTTRFAPAELALSKPDAARVRAIVKGEV